MSHADGIWVAHVAEQVTGMETHRRKTGKKCVSLETCGGECEDVSENCGWQATKKTYEQRCAA